LDANWAIDAGRRVSQHGAVNPFAIGTDRFTFRMRLRRTETFSRSRSWSEARIRQRT
jgi:hypothetical protein